MEELSPAIVRLRTEMRRRVDNLTNEMSPGPDRDAQQAQLRDRKAQLANNSRLATS